MDNRDDNRDLETERVDLIREIESGNNASLEFRERFKVFFENYIRHFNLYSPSAVCRQCGKELQEWEFRYENKSPEFVYTCPDCGVETLQSLNFLH